MLQEIKLQESRNVHFSTKLNLVLLVLNYEKALLCRRRSADGMQ
jgi:hypothetical protein